MKRNLWKRQFSILVKEILGITIEDTGITIDEFYERFGDSGETLPMDALEAYANKYDLDINHA